RRPGPGPAAAVALRRTAGRGRTRGPRAGRAVQARRPGGGVGGQLPRMGAARVRRRAGRVTLVTVNPAYQADELAHVLGHSGARGIFLAAEHRGSSLPAILATVRDRLPELRE